MAGKTLVQLGRVEGYSNPQTGEIWLRFAGAETDGQPKSADGVGVTSQALFSDRPGFCEVTEGAGDGTIGSSAPGTFEWFTWGQLPAAMWPGPNYGSSVSSSICAGRVGAQVLADHPQPAVDTFFTTFGALCFYQRLGNYSGQNFAHVYLDVDQFSGDPNQQPYQPSWGDRIIDTPVLGAPEFAGDKLRDAPSGSLGLWDFGPLADGAFVDTWMFFRLGSSTAYRYSGYLVGEVSEDCDTPADDDCDNVANDGCSEFVASADCFANADCASGVCSGTRSITSEQGPNTGGELADDVPGVCLGAAGDSCTTDADCATNLACAGASVCVGDGALRFTYEWTVDRDWDAYVTTPALNTISYQQTMADGGQLDVDNGGSPAGQPHIENITFTTSPPNGDYSFWIQNFNGLESATFTINVYENGTLKATQTETLGIGSNTPSTHFPYHYPASCTDGILNVGEGCDDGNAQAGDGCTESCVVEPLYDCSGSPSVCEAHVADRTATLVLGQPNFTSNTTGTTTQSIFSSYAIAVAVDPNSGKVFVSEGSRVLRYASFASLSNGANAEIVLGHPSFTNNTLNEGGVSASSMAYAHGLSVDGGGRLWVSDAGNNRVLRFDNASTIGTGAAANGILGQAVFTTAATGLTATTMNLPNGLFADSAGRLWVADYNNYRVLRFDNAAAKANGAAADGVLGQPNFTSNAIAINSATVRPVQVFLDPQSRLWAVDVDAGRVVRYNNAPAKANGAAADGFLGQASFTSANLTTVDQRTLNHPLGVAVSPSGWVYVSDSTQNRILAFSPADAMANGSPAAYVIGQPNFVSSTGSVTATGLYDVQHLFFDSIAGVLWAAERGNNRALAYQLSPYTAPTVVANMATRVLGQSLFTTSGMGSSASQMNGPVDVAVDPITGKVFVSDAQNSRVLRYESYGALANGEAAEAVLGQTSISSSTYNAAASQITFDVPRGIHVDWNGRLWVADTGNSRVVYFNNASIALNGAGASGVLGQADFISEMQLTTQGGMRLPRDVFADEAGRVWVSDTGNCRVLRFDSEAALTNGGSADGVLGQADLTTATCGITTQGSLSGPEALWLDSLGRLWVADAGSNRVVSFANASGLANGANASSVLGQTTFTSESAGLSATGLTSPRGVTVTSSGVVYVADVNNRVLAFSPEVVLGNGAAATWVIGQPNFTSSTSSTTASGFAGVGGVSYDEATGVLWVAEPTNNRVMAFAPPPTFRRVFATSTAYRGFEVGGHTGADALCQGRANAVSLGGTWRAWLSTAASSPSTRFTQWTGPYQRAIDGVRIANNWADLTDGSLQNPINRDELNGTFSNWPVWTATNPDGTHAPSFDCAGWTSTGEGNNGQTASTNALWSWQSGSNTICTNFARLYCFEQ